jgi:hypothetical protein
VLLLSAEDDPADTIRPRLDAADGVPERVLVLPAMRVEDGERLPELPVDVTQIEDLVREHGITLIVVDPLMAYLGGEVNSYNDHNIRRALAPLSRLAESTRAAVLVVRHLNKNSGGTNALYRGGGSIGITGAARSVLLAAKDPDDPEKRVLAVTKSNNARLAPSLSFKLTEQSNGVASIGWLGESAHLASDLLASPSDPDDRSAMEEAMDLIQDFLSQGRKPANELKDAARDAEISPSTLHRARRRLGVKTIRDGFGSGGRCLVELPGASKLAD